MTGDETSASARQGVYIGWKNGGTGAVVFEGAVLESRVVRREEEQVHAAPKGGCVARERAVPERGVGEVAVRSGTGKPARTHVVHGQDVLDQRRAGRPA